MAAWLRGRVACGDAVAQHGLAHKASAIAPWPRSIVAAWQGGTAAEVPGLGRQRFAPEEDAPGLRRQLDEIVVELEDAEAARA